MYVPGTGQKKFKCKYAGCTMMFNTFIQSSDHARWGHPKDDVLDIEYEQKKVSRKRKRVQESDNSYSDNTLISLNNSSIFDDSSKSLYVLNDTVFYEKPKEKCKNCSRLIATVSMPLHLEKCNRVLKFKCTHEGCDVAFLTKFNRDIHLRNVHEPPIKCPKKNCNKLVKRSSLHTHLNIVHNKVKIKCNICGKLVQRYNISRHRLCCTSRGQKLFGCTIQGCDAMFSTADSRHHHIHRCHQEPIKCVFKGCGALVKPFYLKTHIRNRHTKKPEKTKKNIDA